MINNENIENRKKFIRPYLSYHLECEPFINTSRVVYLKRTFEVKAENILMFKFSNNCIQVMQQGVNKILLVANEELVFVTLNNGKETHKAIYNKDNYLECPDRDLIHLYLKFKKISYQMANKK